jgi:hypothetical protein
MFPTDSMSAVVKTAPQYGAEWKTTPIPCEVLVKVLAASICGTDVHIYDWNDWAAHRVKTPQIMGHELAGEVVEVGREVSSVEAGDYVSAETHITCGQCFQCRTGKREICRNLKIVGVDTDGLFADYMVLPETNAWKNPRSIPPEVAAIQEPLGNAIDTVLAEDTAGKTCVVVGCGPVGCLAVAVARVSSAPIIRFDHCNPRSLEQQLQANCSDYRERRALIIRDGVFSMDGDIAPLTPLVELVERYHAMIMVDDAHGEGVLGEGGRGAVDHFHLHGRVDVEIGTLSKAFGVVGGFVAGKKLIIDHLRQKGRPFLFSSAVTPADVAACITTVDILESSGDLVDKLWSNTHYFKQRMRKAGFDIGRSETPITPVMLGEARIAQEFSQQLFDEGVFAAASGFPTVPLGKARIRVMISAAHSEEDLDFGIEKLIKVAGDLRLI